VRVLLLLMACLALPAAAQDYERERRWEREIVPALVVGEPLKLRAAGREFLAIHTPAANARGAVVLAHGRNVHPDHEIIGVLRMRLADLGYTTLSVQMPILGPEATRLEDYYPRLFPEAAERLHAAGRWLQEHGERRLALVSHSMGSWMANEYFDSTDASPYRAWVCMGLTGGFSWPTYRSARPILDLYGENDLPTVTGAAWRRRLTIAIAPEGSRQVEVAGADHFFTGRDAEVAKLVAEWLDAVLGRATP
jgi:pimeloyl-ACP methyl ester carboxylesterase